MKANINAIINIRVQTVITNRTTKAKINEINENPNNKNNRIHIEQMRPWRRKYQNEGERKI